MCCPPYSSDEKQISILIKDNDKNCWKLIENKYPKPLWGGFHAGAPAVLKQWKLELVAQELRSEHASIKLQIDGHLLHY